MKKQVNSRASSRLALGLTQEDFGRMLGISRAQVAQYEVGSRSLPKTAAVLLAKVAIHLEQNQPMFSEKKRKTEMADFYQKLLEENIHLQQYVDRKLEKARRKRQVFFHQRSFAGLFGDGEEMEDVVGKTSPVPAVIATALGKYSPFEVERLELKLETLKHESALLQGRLTALDE